jgi:hypothetical protein
MDEQPGELCVPANAPQSAMAAARLRVTTEDIEGGHVRFTLRKGDTIVAQGPGKLTPGVKTTALCIGAKFRVDVKDRDAGGDAVAVVAYLDDDSSPVP